MRGLGGAALEAVLEARKAGGPFDDLFDFASRVDAKRINKGVLEALVQCGAFDATLARAGSRARARSRRSRSRSSARAPRAAIASAGRRTCSACSTPRRHRARRRAGDGAAAGDYSSAEPWDRREMLVREKKALGFYVSGHPLDRYVKGAGGLAKLEAVPARVARGA